MMNPMAAALAGALVSGVAMYAVGTRAAETPLTENPALVRTMDGQYVAYQPAYANALRPVVAAPAPVRRTVAAPQRTVYRAPAATATSAQERVVSEQDEVRPTRSKTKTALIIGGSAASGAGVGAMIGGKKGALIGAAIGGGAASIYEATRRR